MKIGFFKGKIVAISPDIEWIQENYDDSIEEVNYIIEPVGRSGCKRVRIDVYIQDVKDNIFVQNIYLQDEDEEFQTGSIRYINQIGDTQIVREESQLFESFKKFEEILSWKDKSGKITEKWVYGSVPNEKLFIADKEYRIAKRGEVDLVNLVKLIKDISGKNPEETVLFKEKTLEKFFEGDFTVLEDLIDDDKDFHAVFLAYVQNQKQKIWSHAFPLKLMTDINNNMNISKYNKKIFEKFTETLSYCKGVYKLEKLRELKDSDIPKKEEIEEDDSNY